MKDNVFHTFQQAVYGKPQIEKKATFGENIFENFKRSLREVEIAPEVKEQEESDMDKVISEHPQIAQTLMKLLTSQKEWSDVANEEIHDIVTDIKELSKRPTTLRIVFKNANYMDLKYDPTPQMVKYPDKFAASDYFRVRVLGKTYDLGVNSQYEQCLDQIAVAMRQNPIDTSNPDEQDQATASGEGGGEEESPLPPAEETK